MVGGNPDDPYKVGVEIFEPVSGQRCSFPNFLFPSKDHSQVVHKMFREIRSLESLDGK